MILSKSQERSRFIRFAIVGFIGAIVDFGLFNLLIRLAGVAAIVASAISFIAAVLSNFLWNRYWTYPDSRSKHILHQLTQFGLVSLVGLGIRLGLFAILETPLISMASRYFPNFLDPAFIGHNATLAISILIVMLWNFFANRFWTYSDIE